MNEAQPQQLPRINSEETANGQLAAPSQCCECSHNLWWCEWSAEHWTYLFTKRCTNTNTHTATTMAMTDDPTMTTSEYYVRMHGGVNINLVILLNKRTTGAINCGKSTCTAMCMGNCRQQTYNIKLFLFYS